MSGSFSVSINSCHSAFLQSRIEAETCSGWKRSFSTAERPPLTSDLSPLGKHVLDIDTKITNSVLDLGVSQNLHSAQVAGGREFGGMMIPLLRRTVQNSSKCKISL
ncbi:hypothetical protein MES5069_210002 [Mesorhizobium escarrei]|uniref:Uncharacterized protein n=1 Tax=Mesorhizobium escarrei TaxID=666018 RepID=A0ABM9DQE8_9HYPH|nr:hypothetical protein MES5069_210002 [Mesorhizobium escarrei]